MDFINKTFDFKPGDRCIVIGEIGVNHNGSEELLFRLIDEGITAGLDVIKLQRFVSEDEIAASAPSTQYQREAGEGDNQLAMAQKLELPDELLVKAFDYCREKGAGFLCTAFEHKSVDFLANKIGCKTIKVPSPEVTNKPLLEHMAKAFDGMLLSTGASYLSEVSHAVDWVLDAGMEKEKLALMHCVSEYPAPIEQSNLKCMRTMSEAFGLPVGYSDHTPGIVAAVAAAAMGGAMIEKHYTLDKSLPGPDHQASIDIAELRELTSAVRLASASIGDGVKRPVPAEAANRPLIRKSVTCGAESLAAGTVITQDMLMVKRPWVAGAVEPYDMQHLVGMKLTRDTSFDAPIMWDDFK